MTVDRRGASRTHGLVSGGPPSFSAESDQFPDTAPKYLERARGAYVWDELDNRFLDWTMGLGAMTLGYGRADIDRAATRETRGGDNRHVLPVEAELAQELVDLIPAAEVAEFARDESVVTTAAIEQARAYTGRPYIAYCADRPFYAFHDRRAGPAARGGTVLLQASSYLLPFAYNDLPSLQALFDIKPGEIAAVIMEPATDAAPRDGFLEEVAAKCEQEGALLILDETTTGFRWHIRGAQAYFGMTPDLSIFGKGMANGYAAAALVGRREVMEAGRPPNDHRRGSFFSPEHGADNASLAAARAVIALCREEPVVDHLWRTGVRLIEGLNDAARGAGVGEYFKAYGFPCRPEYVCTEPGTDAPSLGLRTLFMQEMLRGGILLSCISPSYAHGEREVEVTLAVARHAFGIYACALEDGWGRYLKGEPIRPLFRAHN